MVARPFFHRMDFAAKLKNSNGNQTSTDSECIKPKTIYTTNRLRRVKLWRAVLL